MLFLPYIFSPIWDNNGLYCCLAAINVEKGRHILLSLFQVWAKFLRLVRIISYGVDFNPIDYYLIYTLQIMNKWFVLPSILVALWGLRILIQEVINHRFLIVKISRKTNAIIILILVIHQILIIAINFVSISRL